MARDHAHAVVRVHYHGRRRLFQDLDLRHGFQRSVDDPVDVDGLESVAAMALNAAAVAFKQHIRTDGRILSRYAVTGKRIGQKSVHQFP